MTPDRDFVIDLVPGHEHAAVGQGAAHAFKFASVFGKSLVELVFDGKAESDVSDWSIDATSSPWRTRRRSSSSSARG